MGWGVLLSRTALEVYAVIALALFALGLKHGYDERRRDEGRAEVQAKFDAYKDMATKRATDLALLWAKAIDKVSEESAKRQEADREKNEALAQRAAALSRAPTIVLSADAVGVWNDIAAGPPVPAKPSTPASGEAGTKAISESALVGFVNSAKAAYDDAVGLFHDARDALVQCIAANHAAQPETMK